MALRWLGLARARLPRLLDPIREAAGRVVPLQPCLRDARPEHFLFEGDASRPGRLRRPWASTAWAATSPG